MILALAFHRCHLSHWRGSLSFKFVENFYYELDFVSAFLHLFRWLWVFILYPINTVYCLILKFKLSLHSWIEWYFTRLHNPFFICCQIQDQSDFKDILTLKGIQKLTFKVLITYWKLENSSISFIHHLTNNPKVSKHLLNIIYFPANTVQCVFKLFILFTL